MDITVIGLLAALIMIVVVFGGFAFYRRNIHPGPEPTDPDKFTQ